jgi:hypothetical protein
VSRDATLVNSILFLFFFFSFFFFFFLCGSYIGVIYFGWYFDLPSHVKCILRLYIFRCPSIYIYIYELVMYDNPFLREHQM